MMGRNQHLVPIQIRQRHIRRVSLLCMNQNIRGRRHEAARALEFRGKPLRSTIVEPAPARHAVKIGLGLHARKLGKLRPTSTAPDSPPTRTPENPTVPDQNAAPTRNAEPATSESSDCPGGNRPAAFISRSFSRRSLPSKSMLSRC